MPGRSPIGFAGAANASGSPIQWRTRQLHRSTGKLSATRPIRGEWSRSRQQLASRGGYESLFILAGPRAGHCFQCSPRRCCTTARATTAGIGPTIVFPLASQTTSFTSEVTLFNPGASAFTASITFHEANNSATPGLATPCNDVSVPAGRTVQIHLSTQCTLTATSHFGLLIISDKASPKTHNFYGFIRVQNPSGIGFSVEGFPLEDFNNQVSHVIGLTRQGGSPGYWSNCFVGSLDQPVSYSLKLFNGASGAQIGNTLTGSLAAFKQFRYLDVFGVNGVNAPAGDQFNVRAEFTQTSGGSANLIGFCTVQENTTFGADFRVAKSYGSPSGSFFAEGGNAFGTTATLGTTDNQPLNVIVNGGRVMHYEQTATSPNLVGGFVNNGNYIGVFGATISGGGAPGNAFFCNLVYGCQNSVTDHFGTIGGGAGNQAGDTVGDLESAEFATVGGGLSNEAWYYGFVGGGLDNHATGDFASVAGGTSNIASGTYSSIGGGVVNTAAGSFSAVPGGNGNHAGGIASFAAGYRAHADFDGCFTWSDHSFETGASCTTANQFWVRAWGGVVMSAGSGIAAVLAPGSAAWSNGSDRAAKDNLAPVDAQDVLRKVASMPIATWNWKSQDAATRHMGPTAQDFHAAFGLGESPKAINTVDADGVALAAIQALHELVLQKDNENTLLKRRMTRLEALADEVATLKSALSQISTVNGQITLAANR